MSAASACVNGYFTSQRYSACSFSVSLRVLMTSYSSPADLTLPIVDETLLDTPTHDKLSLSSGATHQPRILLLYGSLRERSYSRLLTEEAARILTRLGAETRIYDPQGLPLHDTLPADQDRKSVWTGKSGA